MPALKDALIAHRLTPVLNTMEEIAEWSARGADANARLPAALQIDTGLSDGAFALGAGAYTYRARTIDAVGNLTALSAASTITVITSMPTAAIAAGAGRLRVTP